MAFCLGRCAAAEGPPGCCGREEAREKLLDCRGQYFKMATKRLVRAGAATHEKNKKVGRGLQLQPLWRIPTAAAS